MRPATEIKFVAVAILLAVFAATPAIQANDIAGDIARIHIEAIGGEERVANLSSLRTAGVIVAGGQEMDFQMWAERPNHVRVELESAGLYIVQGWAGEGDPWVLAGENGQVQPMPSGMKESFIADADFDDPLFQSEARGFTVEYAGEDEVDGRPVVRLLATRNITEQRMLYLAADTYFIVQEDRATTRLDGTLLETRIRYGEFRPVRGVILAHFIQVWENGELVNEIRISWMEPNPPSDPTLYTQP
jgi:hypothetical protein